jgi:hypothetical protein
MTPEEFLAEVKKVEDKMNRGLWYRLTHRYEIERDLSKLRILAWKMTLES